MLLPRLINRGLAANDRIKYFLTLFQSARDHADHPNQEAAATGASWEGLLRYDHFTPNASATFAPALTSPSLGTTVFNDQKQNRTIVGVAYWFPHQGNVSAAILVD